MISSLMDQRPSFPVQEQATFMQLWFALIPPPRDRAEFRVFWWSWVHPASHLVPTRTKWAGGISLQKLLTLTIVAFQHRIYSAWRARDSISLCLASMVDVLTLPHVRSVVPKRLCSPQKSSFMCARRSVSR